MDKIKNQEELKYKKKLIGLAERQIKESKERLKRGYLTGGERSRLIEITNHLEKELANSKEELVVLYFIAIKDYNKGLQKKVEKEPAIEDETYIQSEEEGEEEGKIRKLLTQAYSPSNHKKAVAEKANALFEKLYEAGADGAETKQIEGRIRKFAEKMNYDAESGLDKKTLEERIKYRI